MNAPTPTPVRPTLRKSVTFEVLGEEISIPVNYRCIEVIERVFQCSAEVVVSMRLVDPMTLKRYEIANTVVEWMTEFNLLSQHGWSREKVREDVMVGPSEGKLNVIVGCIQAAVLFTLKHVTEEEFEKLCRGEDLDPPKKAEGGTEGNEDADGEVLVDMTPSSDTATPSPAPPSIEVGGAGQDPHSGT